MPGVTYERKVEFTLHGPVVVHVIEAPRPTGLLSLQPVSARDSVQGRDRLTSIEKRLSPTATVAAVNGGLFTPGGKPSGLLLQGGVMQTQPTADRSSLGIDARGTISVDRTPFIGDWRGLGPRRGLSGVNHHAGTNRTVRVTSAGAGPPPAAGDAVEAVFTSFPAATPNTDLTGTVSSMLRGGRHAVPPGGAILYARGNAAARLASEAVAGSSLTARVILPSPFSTSVAGLGGGPLLVRNRRPVFRANEAFSNSWLIPRTARTAVGQRADGSILLVAVDGDRAGYSVGMTNFELAQELAGLGAVTAMGLDSGPSTTMAFDGDLLNRPSGPERPIANALALLYTGVSAPPTPEDFGSTGRSSTTLSYRLVKPSTVRGVLIGPGSTQVTIDEGQRAPRLYNFSWRGSDSDGRPLPEGRWTWRVTAVDDLGRSSQAERSFSFNTTLRTLTVQRGAAPRIDVGLSRGAKLRVTIERSGTVLRTLVNRTVGAGATSVTWNGRISGGLRAPRGTYAVRARATNQIGTVELTASVRRTR